MNPCRTLRSLLTKKMSDKNIFLSDIFLSAHHLPIKEVAEAMVGCEFTTRR
jgi:hypothetical protein